MEVTGGWGHWLVKSSPGEFTQQPGRLGCSLILREGRIARSWRRPLKFRGVTELLKP